VKNVEGSNSKKSSTQEKYFPLIKTLVKGSQLFSIKIKIKKYTARKLNKGKRRQQDVTRFP